MVAMTDLWTGDFGNQYTARNRDEPNFRATIWRALLPRHCESVLEVGANVGHNLEAIASFSPAEIYACEPNDLARQELMERLNDCGCENHITADTADRLSFPDGGVDLVFTCGVLIHIDGGRLLPSMREIHRVARRWIICAEYHAAEERMIPYRGQDNALWLRPYGKLWRKNFPDLRQVWTPLLFEKDVTGLDDVTVWMFEKGERPN